MIGRPSITFRSTINVILIMSCIYVGLLIFCRFQWNPVFAQIASAYCCESRYANAGCDKLLWKANIANMNAAHRVQIPPYLPYLYIYKYVILFSPHDCVEYYICGEISVKYTCEIYVDFANLSIFMDLYCSTCAAITVAGFKWGVLAVFFFSSILSYLLDVVEKWMDFIAHPAYFSSENLGEPFMMRINLGY